MKKILLATLAVMFAASARAADEESDSSYSYYLISCGKYVEHRTRGTPTDNANTADLFYIAGWLSADGRFSADGGLSEDTTLDDVTLWLDQYCRENPLSNLEAGLFHLSEESKSRHAPTPPESKAAPAPQPLQTPEGELKPLTY